MKKLLFLGGLLSFSFVQSNSFQDLIYLRKYTTLEKINSPLIYAQVAYQAYKKDKSNKVGFVLAPLAIPACLWMAFSGFIEKNAINAASSIMNARTAEHDQFLMFNTMETIFGSPLS